MHTIPKYQDIYGANTGAYLVLKGALLAVADDTPEFRIFENDYRLSGRQAVLTKDGVTIDVLYPDTPGAIHQARKLFRLSIREETKSSQSSKPPKLYKWDSVEVGDLVMGLVLVEDLEVEN